VGATTSSDARSVFSNVGGCVDIFAPGSAIISTGIATPTSTAVMSGTSMAAPHVAGVAALILGNQNLTPGQVAQRVSADATLGVITGLTSSTVNALLYQAVTTHVAHGDMDEDEPENERRSTEFDFDMNDAEYGDELPPPPDAQTPTVPTQPSTGTSRPSAPIAGPVASPVVSQVGVRSVKQVGRHMRVRVNAPKGAHLTLYQNGRKVSSGTKTTFRVRTTAGTRVRFHVVAKINGARMKSTVHTFTTRSSR
jgi:subtilisin family serine protease